MHYAFPTQAGWVFVEATERGVCRCGLPQKTWREAVDGARSNGAWLRASRRVLRLVEREMRRYLSGERLEFSAPVDLSGLTPFQRQVLEETRKIPYGETATYGEIARRVGRPGAARAVGQALGSNPVAIIIPCHRVVGANGRLTGFGGGLEWKQMLLDLEGAV
ncbi:MAG: methylated-DNA--[protein]-cysteine S-methyltransferase [Armatimonadota bacterium]